MRKYQPSYVTGNVDIALCQNTSIIHRRCLYSESCQFVTKEHLNTCHGNICACIMTSLVPSGFVARLRYRFPSRPLTVCLREFHPINIHESSSTVHHPAWRLSWLFSHTDGFRVRDHWNPHIFIRLFPFCFLEVKSLYRFLLHVEGNYLLNIRHIGQHFKSNLQVMIHIYYLTSWYTFIVLCHQLELFYAELYLIKTGYNYISVTYCDFLFVWSRSYISH